MVNCVYLPNLVFFLNLLIKGKAVKYQESIKFIAIILIVITKLDFFSLSEENCNLKIFFPFFEINWTFTFQTSYI